MYSGALIVTNHPLIAHERFARGLPIEILVGEVVLGVLDIDTLAASRGADVRAVNLSLEVR